MCCNTDGTGILLEIYEHFMIQLPRLLKVFCRIKTTKTNILTMSSFYMAVSDINLFLNLHNGSLTSNMVWYAVSFSQWQKIPEGPSYL